MQLLVDKSNPFALGGDQHSEAFFALAQGILGLSEVGDISADSLEFGRITLLVKQSALCPLLPADLSTEAVRPVLVGYRGVIWAHLRDQSLDVIAILAVNRGKE